MTDQDREPILVMLRDLDARMMEQMAKTREHLGDAIAEARGEIRTVGDRLDNHIAMDDLRFSGVEERFRRTYSDHKELRGRVDAVDETGRQQALSLERAEALHVHLDKDGERLHGWRKSLTIFALTLIFTLVGFALRGLLGV